MAENELMEPLGIYKSEISVFLQEQRFLSEEAFAEILNQRDELESCVVQIIERGIKTGVFKDVGPARRSASA